MYEGGGREVGGGREREFIRSRMLLTAKIMDTAKAKVEALSPSAAPAAPLVVEAGQAPGSGGVKGKACTVKIGYSSWVINKWVVE